MRAGARLAASAAAAALIAAIGPPLAMSGLWALLSGDPVGFLRESGADGIVHFVLSQQRFFTPVALAGLGVHVVLVCARRCRLLIYVAAFYCIGALVYLTLTVPQIAVFAPEPPVVRTLAFDALLWWGPAAALSGLLFWAIAASSGQ